MSSRMAAAGMEEVEDERPRNAVFFIGPPHHELMAHVRG